MRNNKMDIATLIFLVLVTCHYSNGETLEEGKKEPKHDIATRLFKSLFENYKKEISPTPVHVKFGAALVTTKLNEVDSMLDSNLWLRIVWNDPRLVWNETKYDVGVLRIKPSNVWIPDIQLYNSGDGRSGDLLSSCVQTNVHIYPNGEVLWVPPCQYTSTCKNSLKRFPNEQQTCKLKFGSWTYDGLEMTLSLYNDKPFMDMSDFVDFTDWNVLSAPAELKILKYPCCEEPYVDISFNVTVQRKPLLAQNSSVDSSLNTI